VRLRKVHIGELTVDRLNVRENAPPL